MISLYVPGSSLLHRAPAALKFILLFISLTAVFLSENLIILSVCLAASLAVFLSTGLGLKRAIQAVKPLLPFLAIIIGVQWYFYTLERGSVFAIRLVIAVLLASLLTHTTRTSAILDLFYAVLTPLRRLGISPWRSALVLSVAIKSIPQIANSMRVSRQAYLARGQRTSSYEVIIPVAVRLIRSSEAIGDAISARGLDTDPADLTEKG